MQPEKLGVEITAFMFKKLGVEITAFMFKKLGVEISAYFTFVPVIVNHSCPIQADKLWYNYFIPPSSVLLLFSVKYFVLKF